MKRGFACGVFDLFHAGHVLMLEECRQHCDYLIVAVNKAESISSEINPGKKKPLYSLDDRMLILSSCKFVDEVVDYNGEEELLQLLKKMQVHIRFLGEDYKGKPITGDNLNIEIHYTDRSHGKSSSWFKEQLKTANNL